MSLRRLVALSALAFATIAAPLAAQPDPSFRTDCAGLRAALSRLRPAQDAYVNIDVVDRLQFVGANDAVALLGMCEPPNPRVLCVTYSRDAWKVGDLAKISGTFSEPKPGFIKLDPCLHSRPGS